MSSEALASTVVGANTLKTGSDPVLKPDRCTFTATPTATLTATPSCRFSLHRSELSFHKPSHYTPLHGVTLCRCVPHFIDLSCSVLHCSEYPDWLWSLVDKKPALSELKRAHVEQMAMWEVSRIRCRDSQAGCRLHQLPPGEPNPQHCPRQRPQGLHHLIIGVSCLDL